MKTIALATDFTPNANRVAQFAMQLAHAQQASLLLIHAFHFWPDNPAETGSDFPLSADAMRNDRNVFDTLLTFAQTNKTDLIMMLPQVHNWFRKLFTDGETQQMARLTDIPLLAIV